MAFEGTLQEITVRMHGNETRDTRIEVQQGDTASRKVRIRLKTFGGADYIVPYGARAVLCISKNDGKKVYDECDIEDKNVVLVTLSDQAISCSGLQKAQIYIFSEEGDIKTQVFQVNVPKAVYSDDAIESSDEFGILHELIVENSAIQQAEQIRIEAEETRTASEEERQATMATMATATEACLAVIEDARAVAYARGNAIVQTTSGTSIVVQDSSDDPVRGLRLFGRTTQRKTTGAQLFDVNDIYKLDTGCSIDQDDWITMECDNSGNDATIFRNIYTRASENLQPDTTYLAIIEVDYVDTDLLIYAVSTSSTDIKYISQFTSASTFKTNNVGISIMTVSTVSSFDESTVMIRTFVTFPARTSGKAKFRISILADTTITADTFIYEPYTGGIPSPNPDCPQELVSVGDSGSVEVSITDGTEDNVQSLTIPTPNGLPGIQVTDESLANYTDADGNMWCADEVDLERGVYVQRVCHKVFDGTESYVLNDEDGSKGYHFGLNDVSMEYNTKGSLMGALCNKLCEVNTDVLYGNICEGFSIGYKSSRFRLRFTSLPDITTVDALKSKLAEWYTNGEPLELITLLATPIETPLTADELAQYQALHSNYPVTTVMNDSDAHMEVKYNADTKLYIDNKFAELQTALVALGGN